MAAPTKQEEQPVITEADLETFTVSAVPLDTTHSGNTTYDPNAPTTNTVEPKKNGKRKNGDPLLVDESAR
jgi:hypothetical protein